MISEQDAEMLKDLGEQAKKFFNDLSDTREKITCLMASVCMSDTALRDEILRNGMTDVALAKMKDYIRQYYERALKQAVPDLDWMDKVEFKVMENTDEQYIIPLPDLSQAPAASQK